MEKKMKQMMATDFACFILTLLLGGLGTGLTICYEVWRSERDVFGIAFSRIIHLSAIALLSTAVQACVILTLLL